jgi:hypothetical protein
VQHSERETSGSASKFERQVNVLGLWIRRRHHGVAQVFHGVVGVEGRQRQTWNSCFNVFVDVQTASSGDIAWQSINL